MELGIVGLGRMGANMARRLMRDGHRIVGYDVNPDAVAGLAGEGAEGASSLQDMAAKLSAPRAVWVMVPSGEITEQTVDDVAAVLEPGDAIVDGGNSYYRDDIRRAKAVGGRGIDYVDCGTSGGVFGLERGYCLMIGGPDGAVERLDPIFATLAPGVASAARPPGRRGQGGGGRCRPGHHQRGRGRGSAARLPAGQLAAHPRPRGRGDRAVTGRGSHIASLRCLVPAPRREPVYPRQEAPYA